MPSRRPAGRSAACINRVLFHEWGFRGNVEQYTDPLNSLIDKVLMRRKGIPISLSIVYLLVAERLGLAWSRWACPGISSSAATATRPPFFIDPFDQGLFREPDEVFALLRSKQIVPEAVRPGAHARCARCSAAAAATWSTTTPRRRPRPRAALREFVEEFEATHERVLQS